MGGRDPLAPQMDDDDQSLTSNQSNLRPNGATRISSSNRSNASPRSGRLSPITSRKYDTAQDRSTVGGDVLLGSRGSSSPRLSRGSSTRSKGSRSGRSRRSNRQSNAGEWKRLHSQADARELDTVSRRSRSQKSNRSSPRTQPLSSRSRDQTRPVDIPRVLSGSKVKSKRIQLDPLEVKMTEV